MEQNPLAEVELNNKSQVEPIPEVFPDTKDGKFISEEIEEIQKEEHSTDALAEFSMNYSKEEAIRYITAGNAPIFSKGTIIYMAIFVAIGIVCIVTGSNVLLLLACVFIAGLNPLSRFLSRHIKSNRYYKRTQTIWNGTKIIRIYLDHIETEEQEQIQSYLYDEFYRFKEGEDRLYLIASSKDIIVIDTNQISVELKKSILELFA